MAQAEDNAAAAARAQLDAEVRSGNADGAAAAAVTALSSLKEALRTK